MNKQIVVATAIIAGSGVISSWQAKKPITPVILGAYIFMLLLALLDAFGGDISKLASALALLAMTAVVVNQFPWQTVLGTLQGRKT